MDNVQVEGMEEFVMIPEEFIVHDVDVQRENHMGIVHYKEQEIKDRLKKPFGKILIFSRGDNIADSLRVTFEYDTHTVWWSVPGDVTVRDGKEYDSAAVY